MEITVQFLGPARDWADTGSAKIEVPPDASVATLRHTLAELFPQIKAALGTVRLAVNQSFARDDQPLSEQDEVAVIPPVSGG